MTLALTTAIGRLAIRASAPDSPELRLAVTSQLESADLRPIGVSPSSILLIRALPDPLPGTLRTTLGGAVDRAWEGAMRDRLTSTHRVAARPHRGRVPGRLDAVVFADEAELVACVALALLDQGEPSPWWLRAVARHIPTASLPRLLHRTLPHLPAALSILHRWGDVKRVVAALNVPEARDLLIALAALFDLSPALRASILGGMRAHKPPARGADAGQPVMPPPWPALGGVAPLDALQELLAGTSIVLHRTPARARSALFAQQVASWYATVATLSTTGAGDGRQITPQAEPASTPKNEADAAAERSASAALSATVAGRAGHRTMAAADASQPEPSEATVRAGAEAIAAPAEPHLVEPGGGSAEGAFPSASENDLPEPEPQGDPCARDEEGIETAHGGILYLINIMELLDVPVHLRQTVDPGGLIGAWGLLESIARVLPDTIEPAVASDPVWAVIAGLDGRRSGEPPCCGPLDLTDLRLSSAWLTGIAPGPAAWRWAATEGRLRIWLPDAFTAVDVRCRSRRPDRQARFELRALLQDEFSRDLREGQRGEAPVVELGHLRAAGWPADLVRWLEWLTPFLRWRLARALGRDRVSGCNVVTELYGCPARLYLSESHLDLVAPLDAVSLPLRLAGLDRSPGWVAALGRVVLFHFD